MVFSPSTVSAEDSKLAGAWALVEGKRQVTAAILKSAEGLYSRDRVRSIGDEWYSNYPDLLDFIAILKGRPDSFALSDITSRDIEELCLKSATSSSTAEGPLVAKARELIDELIGATAFRDYLVRVFYRVGLVGLKTEACSKVMWSFIDEPSSVQVGVLGDDTRVNICPAFYSVLGTRRGRSVRRRGSSATRSGRK